METVDLLKQLEINYKLISNDLEFASHELDSRMAAAARADSSIPDLHALQSRIRSLQTAMPGLAGDATEVVRRRQETEPILNAAVLENFDVMVGLYARLGVVPDPDWVGVAESVRDLAPAPRESTPAESVGPGRGGVDGGGSAGGAEAMDSAVHSGRPEMGASRVDEGSHRKSSAVIFEEDFLAVSSNTRGRSRLQDVRKVYAKIREDFEEKASRARPGSKPDPITKRELDAAGLKVFGLTGDSILNTLRAMGLTTMSKGSVTLAS